MISLFFPLVCSIFMVVAQQATAENYYCFDKGSYTLNSTYHDNLNHLLSTLPNSQNNNGYGFYNLSYGNAADQVFAMALCDGDAMPDSCQRCLNESTHLVQQLCPYQKEVVLWHNNCMLRYSNRSLFGFMESFPRVILYNTQNASSDPDTVEAYFKDLRSLLDNLKSRAMAGGSLKKFALDSIKSAGFKTIYGLVQCSPDLSKIDCNNCLDDSFGNLPGCCNLKKGGVVLGTSCRHRYEDYLFYDISNVTQAPPPSPMPQPPPPQPLTVPGRKKESSATVIVVIVFASTVALGIIMSIFVCLRKRNAKTLMAQTNKHPLISNERMEEVSVESLQYDYETIKLATGNFSKELGKGGFGVVYKGRFSNGQDIAVKKLTGESAQCDVDFKNEVMLVAKLQHRNLVRLLGFSLESRERLLVYEFVKNGRLDHFIFDPTKRENLDWDRRYKIIGGVARGLLYLHEDSRLKIIHRDLKASNILLDEEMHPKISDFGTARHFVVDQTQDSTSRIVGTYGYMAPEYVMHGQYSVKSDIFSFGVLILEIISGQKNCVLEGQHERTENLLTYTWRHWREGNATKIIDPVMRGGRGSEIMRCIHIGLLCVQTNLVNRPTMNSIVLMLNSNSVSLPVPSQPAFYMHSNTGGVNHNQLPQRESVNEASITEISPR